MAISASQIATTNTLEQLRVQFNNLQTDVNGLESGTLTFSSVSATTTSTSALNILEDGTIVFEGATDDGFETILTVADPTADRTITLPDATGTVFLTNTTATAVLTDKTAISSGDVASGTDVLLLADVDAGELKKVTVDNIFSSVGGLASVAGDSTPQLGGDLDLNGNSIVTTSNADINLTPNGTGDVVLAGDTVKVGDSGAAATLTSNGAGALTVTTGGTEDLTLSTNSGTNSGTIVITDGANNNITLTPNGTGDVVLAADTVTVGDAGAAATLSSSGAGALTVTTGGAADLVLNTNSGTDSSSITITDAANGNISAALNGTGVFQIDGSDGVEIQQGAISIKNGGAQSYVRFYCESSNAHYVQLQAPAHSDFSGDVTVTLPVGTATVATLTLAETLTNKTLTSPQINTAILPASADGATLGSATKEFSDLFLADGGTIQFGNDQEITLTHVADSGLTLKHAATADDKFPTLSLAAGDTDIAANDVLGRVAFIAPDEGTGTDAILNAGVIDVFSEGDFAADSNAASMRFLTGNSAAAGTDGGSMILSSTGNLTLKDLRTADGSSPTITLQSGDTDIAANDVLGTINFQAPDEGTGTDAILVAAGIEAVSEGDFAADANATKLSFKTAASAAAAETMALSSGGNLTVAGTIVPTGAITANAGVVVDNITIDGTEIDLSSGDLTLDVAADIILDAAGEHIIFKDGSTNVGHVHLDSDNLTIKSLVQDKDIILKGEDGTSTITALTLDMSEAGAATFNNDVTAFSDERLKTDIETIENGLEKLMKLRGVTYKRNDVENAKMQMGVIAQEIEEVVPEVVKTADDEMGTKSVDYGKLTALLIESVKELGEVIASDVQRIEKQMESLKNYVYDNLSSYGEDIKELKKMHSKNGHVGDHDH